MHNNPSKPLVSILMTTYNRAQYIEEAIESVIASTYTNWELIIVDDCSTDNTEQLVKKYLSDPRIQYHRNEKNLGQFPNRNKAASLANGKYIKYLDSDDIIYFFGLELLVRSMEQYPDAVLGVASQDHLSTEVRYPALLTPREAYLRYFEKNEILVVGPSGTIFKRDVFMELNGYTSTHATADTVLMLKIAAKNATVLVQPAFFYYRKHENQVLNEIEKLVNYTEGLYKNGLMALQSNECPLNSEEIKRFKKSLDIKISKIAFIQFKRGNIMKALKILNLLKQKNIEINKIQYNKINNK